MNEIAIAYYSFGAGVVATLTVFYLVYMHGER